VPRARGGQSVRPPRSALDHRLDQTGAFESGDRAVERSWAETPPGHHVSMLLDRVAVLRPFSQADENKQAPGPIDILRVA